MSAFDPGAIAPIVPAIQAATPVAPAQASVDTVSGGAPPAAPPGNGAVAPWYQPPAVNAPPVSQAPTVPPPIRSRRPSMASATEAADQATQGGYDTAAAQEAIAPAKTAEREGNAAEQHKAAIQATANAAEIERTQRAQSEGIKQARDIANLADEEYKNFKFHDYWSTRPASEHLKAQIFSGLGEFAAILSGTGRNQAAQNINSLIQRDFDQQKAKLSSLENFAKMKSEGVTSLSAQFKNDIAVLGLKQAAATNAVAEEAKAQAIRNGEAPEQAENNALVKQIRQKALELRAKNEADLEKARAALAMAGMKAAPNQPADPNVLAAIAKFAQQPGVTQGDVYAAAAKAGIKNSNKELQPILDNVNATEAKKNKADEAAEKNSVHLADGKSYQVASGRGGAQAFGTRDADFGTALDQLAALRDDVKTNGERTLLNGSNRDALYNNATGAAAVVSPLGKNLESIEIEKGAIGPSGSPIGHSGTFDGTVRGAQPAAIDRKIEEVKKKREAYRREMLVGYGKSNADTPSPAKSGGESTVVKVRDKKTGEVHSVRMGDDGKYHTVDEDIKL